jgi:hypothetical protein
LRQESLPPYGPRVLTHEEAERLIEARVAEAERLIEAKFRQMEDRVRQMFRDHEQEDRVRQMFRDQERVVSEFTKNAETSSCDRAPDGHVTRPSCDAGAVCADASLALQEGSAPMKRMRWDDAKYGFWFGLKAGLLHPMVLRWAFGIVLVLVLDLIGHLLGFLPAGKW